MAIPGERTKNHRALILPLPAVALDILLSTPRREGREHVFCKRGAGFNAWSYATMRLHSRITMAQGKPLPHWTLHDLRRSFRTGVGRLGVAPHIAERIINHIKGGVEAIYDRYTYQREIGTALAMWADHILSVVEGRESNVIAMRNS